MNKNDKGLEKESNLWIVNFFRELKSWRIVRKTFRQHRREFDRLKIRSDWFGRLYLVLNRDPDITLGSDEDTTYLHNEMAKLTMFLTKMGLIGNLAYVAEPFEEKTPVDKTHIEISQGYLVTLTPAWNLDRQYVTGWSVFFIILLLAGIITGLTFLILALV